MIMNYVSEATWKIRNEKKLENGIVCIKKDENFLLQSSLSKSRNESKLLFIFAFEMLLLSAIHDRKKCMKDNEFGLRKGKGRKDDSDSAKYFVIHLHNGFRKSI